MLIYAYLFSLIVGGVLLGASIILGGHDDVDTDGGDFDFDADVDADVDADIDADADADGGADKDVAVDEVGGHGDFAGLLVMFLSLRFWTFFLAFFGFTGLLVQGLELVGSQWLGLAISIAMGFVCGAGAVTAIRTLSRDTSGSVASINDYVGKSARVLVPFDGDAVGKVRVEIKGSQVDLLATGLDQSAFSGKDEVLIVEMDGPRARVVANPGASKSES